MPQMKLPPGYIVKFEAIDVATGVAVSGVTVSQAVIFADDALAGEDTVLGDGGPFMLVPGPTPVSTAAPVTVRGGL